MLTLRCPACRRLLKFPEELAGALVQCPACRHEFHAPGGETPPPAPTPAPATPRGRPRPAAAGAPGSGFDLPFDDEPRHDTTVRVWVNSAASWLMSTLV